MFLVSALAVTLFLGGWHGPWLPGPVWFIFKSMCLVFLQMWLRWTLPRLRVDQLMYVSWKVLLPIAFLLVLAAGTVALITEGPA